MQKAFKTVKVKIALIVAFCLATLLPHSTYSQSEWGYITVTIESSSEGRIAGQSVIVHDDEGLLRSGRTNKLGEARLRLPRGLYTVIVQRKGYLGIILKDVNIRENSNTKLHLQLRQEGERRAKERTPVVRQNL